jgi:hypothetical protein
MSCGAAKCAVRAGGEDNMDDGGLSVFGEDRPGFCRRQGC